MINKNTIDSDFDYLEYNNELLIQQNDFIAGLRDFLSKTGAELQIHPETGIQAVLPNDKTIGQHNQSFCIGFNVNQYSI